MRLIPSDFPECCPVSSQDLHSGWPEAFSRPCCAIRWRIRTSLASLPVQAQVPWPVLYCSHTSSTTVYLVSIAAGLGTTLVMFALAKGRRFSTSKLILIGIGVQAMLNAVVSYILEAGAEQDIATAMRWLSGSLNGVRLSELYLLLAAVLITTPVILVFSRQLAMLELGEEWAAGLGVSPDRVRFILMTGSVLLIATATAATGPIAFVSFLAGPIAKRLTGHGTASPLASGLFGAVLVLLSDLVGQFAFELRFPVGVITGILGAPYLLFLLVRMNKSGEL